MKISHFYGKDKISKPVKHPVAQILVNHRKDFATFYAEQQSRYEGFFAAYGDTFIKTVSRIDRVSSNPIPKGLDVHHDDSAVALHYGKTSEVYHLIENEPVLVYESSTKTTLRVRLDMRDQFYIPQWGRNYTVYPKKDMVIVGYSDDRVYEPVYLAIGHDGSFEQSGEWIAIEYERDKQRFSEPTLLYEYVLGEFKAKKLVVAFGASEEEAEQRLRKNLASSKLEKILAKDILEAAKGKAADEIAKKIARFCAEKALDSLFIENSMLAGMPWFTSAWVRDELISLPAFPKNRAQSMISKYVWSDYWKDGRFPVVFGGENCCSDGLGLLCWGILFGRFAIGNEEQKLLSKKLPQAIKALEAIANEHGFIPSWARESWMDSIDRVGYPIETQALFSKILHLAQMVCEDDTHAEKRHSFLEKVREHYFVDGYLYDRYGDPTMRPNLFLAALFDPELLTKAEWESCFDKVLPPLWLEWGGLSSVDVCQECFCDVSTGERDISYHNGDSWFFVNNIAAMVLSNINAKKYAKYIDGILNASIEEVLWHNYVGAPGEVSSARALESWGCGLQGFSSSAFLYLVDKSSLMKKLVEERLA